MSKARYILVIDPGKTSGIAYHDTVEDKTEFAELNFGETAEFIHSAADLHRDNLIIISESFLITPNTAKNTQAPWSLELIGVARYAAQKYTGRDLQTQMPSAAKRFASDARLRHIGWWTKGKGGHANDAARHLLLFEATRGYIEEERLAALSEIF